LNQAAAGQVAAAWFQTVKSFVTSLNSGQPSAKWGG
jgi:hypothetical protein